MAEAILETVPAAAPGVVKVERSESYFQLVWRRFRKSTPATVGGLIVLILVILAVFADFFAPYPDPGTLAADLHRVIAATDNEQDLLDVARRWTNDQRFRIAVHQLKGIMTPEAACVAYADLVAAVVSEMTARVTADFEHQHGGFGAPRLAVVALGKLGSREMTVSSNLDLMFVYDVPEGQEQSDGVRPLATTQYYTRLSQKIIAALTSLTNEGLLYEDWTMRRPESTSPSASLPRSRAGCLPGSPARRARLSR